MLIDHSANLTQQSSSIKFCIELLNELKVKVLFIIDSKDKLIGTVTDGDIRRAILNGNDLSEPILTAINKNFIKNENIIDDDYIQTTTLNSVLETSHFKGKKIDFLNIDTEGNDLKVLKSLNFDVYNPSIIIVETHLKRIDLIIKSEIYLFLISHKYILKSWNLYSLIFIKESYYENN